MGYRGFKILILLLANASVVGCVSKQSFTQSEIKPPKYLVASQTKNPTGSALFRTPPDLEISPAPGLVDPTDHTMPGQEYTLPLGALLSIAPSGEGPWQFTTLAGAERVETLEGSLSGPSDQVLIKAIALGTVELQIDNTPWNRNPLLAKYVRIRINIVHDPRKIGLSPAGPVQLKMSGTAAQISKVFTLVALNPITERASVTCTLETQYINLSSDDQSQAPNVLQIIRGSSLNGTEAISKIELIGSTPQTFTLKTNDPKSPSPTLIGILIVSCGRESVVVLETGTFPNGQIPFEILNDRKYLVGWSRQKYSLSKSSSELSNRPTVSPSLQFINNSSNAISPPIGATLKVAISPSFSTGDPATLSYTRCVARTFFENAADRIALFQWDGTTWNLKSADGSTLDFKIGPADSKTYQSEPLCQSNGAGNVMGGTQAFQMSLRLIEGTDFAIAESNRIAVVTLDNGLRWTLPTQKTTIRNEVNFNLGSLSGGYPDEQNNYRVRIIYGVTSKFRTEEKTIATGKSIIWDRVANHSIRTLLNIPKIDFERSLVYSPIALEVFDNQATRKWLCQGPVADDISSDAETSCAGMDREESVFEKLLARTQRPPVKFDSRYLDLSNAVCSGVCIEHPRGIFAGTNSFPPGFALPLGGTDGFRLALKNYDPQWDFEHLYPNLPWSNGISLRPYVIIQGMPAPAPSPLPTVPVAMQPATGLQFTIDGQPCVSFAVNDFKNIPNQGSFPKPYGVGCKTIPASTKTDLDRARVLFPIDVAGTTGETPDVVERYQTYGETTKINTIYDSDSIWTNPIFTTAFVQPSTVYGSSNPAWSEFYDSEFTSLLGEGRDQPHRMIIFGKSLSDDFYSSSGWKVTLTPIPSQLPAPFPTTPIECEDAKAVALSPSATINAAIVCKMPVIVEKNLNTVQITLSHSLGTLVSSKSPKETGKAILPGKIGDLFETALNHVQINSSVVQGDIRTYGKISPVHSPHSICTRHPTTAYQVLCWGANPRGILGPDQTPSLIGNKEARAAFALSSSSAPVTFATNSTYHGCAIQNGRVYCWGGNEFGQTGQDKQVLPYHREVKEVTLPTSNIVRLSLTPRSSCALAATGEVYCWGNIMEVKMGSTKNDFSWGSRTPSASSAPVNPDVAGNLITLKDYAHNGVFEIGVASNGREVYVRGIIHSKLATGYETIGNDNYYSYYFKDWTKVTSGIFSLAPDESIKSIQLATPMNQGLIDFTSPTLVTSRYAYKYYFGLVVERLGTPAVIRSVNFKVTNGATNLLMTFSDNPIGKTTPLPYYVVAANKDADSFWFETSPGSGSVRISVRDTISTSPQGEIILPTGCKVSEIDDRGFGVVVWAKCTEGDPVQLFVVGAARAFSENYLTGVDFYRQPDPKSYGYFGTDSSACTAGPQWSSTSPKVMNLRPCDAVKGVSP